MLMLRNYLEIDRSVNSKNDFFVTNFNIILGQPGGLVVRISDY